MSRLVQAELLDKLTENEGEKKNRVWNWL